MSEINQRPQRSPAMYAIVLAAAYLTFLVLSPFLAPLIWAVIFGILFHGWQKALARKLRPGPAALVTTLVAGVRSFLGRSGHRKNQPQNIVLVRCLYSK